MSRALETIVVGGGRDGGWTIDLRALALAGVKLHGRLLDTEGDRVRLADDLAASLDAAAEVCRETMALVDRHIAERGLSVPAGLDAACVIDHLVQRERAQ